MWIAIQNAIGARQGVGGGPGPTPPPYTPPLDDYPATFAYSVRKLSSTYSGSALRVRRNAPPFDEQDIGFTPSGDLDEAAIVAFGGSDELRVSALYDQSGQSNDSGSSIPGNQPKIYNGTSVITENGKPAFEFSGITGGFDFINATQITIGSYRTDFAVTSPANITSTLGVFTTDTAFRAGTSTGRYAQNLRWNSGVIGSISFDAGGSVVVVNGSTTVTANTQHLTTGEYDGTNLSVYLDGTLDGTTSQASQITGTSFVNVASAFSANSGLFEGKMQEIIDYQIDRSAERIAIETNINDYYKIIVNDEAATSGFLFDYPNAAVAYSVRQLNNNAEFAMQVERSDGRTKNIGFDGNGDLDTQAIIGFAGASVATIRQWYDQTGAQNHVTQITPGKQPQIYNGTAVITENGKPAVEFDGTDDSLNKLFNTGVSDEMDCFVIAKDITNQQYDGIYSLAPNNSANRDWNDAGGRFIQMQATAGSKEFYSYLANLSIIHGSGTNQYLIETAMNSGTGYFWHSASQTELTDTYTFTPLEAKGVALACRWTNNSSLNAHSEIRMQEFILYPTYQGTNRGNIRTDINDYYNIP